MPSPVEWQDFCSPAYRLDVTNSASSRMVNIFPELVEKGPRAGKLRLRGIPGLKEFTVLSDSPMRALLAIDSGNRLFAVAGGTVYEVFADGTSQAAVFTDGKGTVIPGSLALSSHPAIMATNGFQLAVASGGLLYMVNGVVGGPAQVFQLNFIDGTPIPAGTLTFLTNYFIIDQINSKAVFISNLAPNGNIWDPGDTKIKEGYPDNVAAVFADDEFLFVHGFDDYEIWAPSSSQFPFDRIQGAVVKYGCSAPFSVAGALGKHFWLWQNAVYMAYGTSNPARVSDFGVEEQIATYTGTQDAEGWCQVVGGHLFYVLHVGGHTWVFDVSTGAWHERGLWANGKYGQYRGRVFARAFGKDLVGDLDTGRIFELDPKTFTDANGVALRRERTCPYLTMSERLIRHNRLIIDYDTAVGLDVAPDVLGFDPQMTMRYSNDRGKTYSNELSTSLGKVGETERRVIYKQLGSSRIGRVYQTVVTDPVPYTVNAAYLDLNPPEAGR